MSKATYTSPGPGGYPQQPGGGAPPAPPGYAPPGQQYPAAGGPQTVVITQPGPVVLANQAFREAPVTMTCPHCQAQITTSTHYKVGTLTWIVCGGICLIGLSIPLVWLGCCLIPFCVNSLKDVIHECPNCQSEVGRLDRTR